VISLQIQLEQVNLAVNVAVAILSTSAISFSRMSKEDRVEFLSLLSEIREIIVT
jgi:hypothetical protein